MSFDFGKPPAHVAKRHKKTAVPDLGSLDGVVLPAMALPMHGEILMAQPMEREAVLDSSAKLDGLTQKALDFYDDLLGDGPDMSDPKVLSAQTDAARTILTTQLRVDDTRLRKRNVDTLAKLLARIAEEEPKLVTSS